MALHRADADEEAFCDLPVRYSLGYQPQDLFFAIRKRAEQGYPVAGWVIRHAGGKIEFPLPDFLDGRGRIGEGRCRLDDAADNCSRHGCSGVVTSYKQEKTKK